MTPRESEVGKLVSKGMKNKSIACKLGIAEGTVKRHIHNIYQKTGMKNRTQIALLYLRRSHD